MLVYRFLRVYPVWELLQMNRNCPAPVSTHSIVTLDHPMIICEALASGIPLLGARFEQRSPSKKGVLCRQTHNRSEDDIVRPVSARCVNVFNCLPLPWVLSPSWLVIAPAIRPIRKNPPEAKALMCTSCNFLALQQRKLWMYAKVTENTNLCELAQRYQSTPAFWYSDTCHGLKLLHSQRPINAEGLHFAGAGQKLASCTRISS